MPIQATQHLERAKDLACVARTIGTQLDSYPCTGIIMLEACSVALTWPSLLVRCVAADLSRSDVTALVGAWCPGGVHSPGTPERRGVGRELASNHHPPAELSSTYN